jgi:hypothetical protein
MRCAGSCSVANAIGTRIGSHNEKEANKSLQHPIARQMKLSAREFTDFVECRLGAEEYSSLVIRRG